MPARFKLLLVAATVLLAPQDSVSQTTSRWSGLDLSSDVRLTSVTALATGPGDALFAAGSFVTPQGQIALSIGKWTDGTWQLIAPDFEPRSAIYAMEVSGGALYVAGRIRSVAGVSTPGIAVYQDEMWRPVGEGIESTTCCSGTIVNAIEADGNGGVFVGGDFDRAGVVQARNIAHWTGNVWSDLAGGTSGLVVGQHGEPIDLVQDLVVAPDGSLYAAGKFTLVDDRPMNRVARWKDGQWSPLGNGMDSGTVTSLAHDGERLFASGHFERAGTVVARNVAQWENDSWASMGDNVCFAAYSMILSEGKLFAGSGSCDSTRRGMRWDGNSWTEIENGPESFVSAMAPFRGGVLFGLHDSSHAGSQNVGALGFLEPSAALGRTDGVDEGSSIQVYPNPSEDEFTVVLDGGEAGGRIVLLDMLGREVDSKQVRHDAGPRYVRIAAPHPGVFLLVIETENRAVVKPIARL